MNREEMLSRESRHWAHLASEVAGRSDWLDSPTVQRHVSRLVTGQEITWFDWVRAKYLSGADWRVGRGLCLGSNHGLFERQIVAAGICSGFDSYDISDEAVRIAQLEADSAGLDIRCHVADVNELELAEQTYSLAVVSMSLHHFERLEFILRQVHDSLLLDGLFVFNEFVGPTRFQWTDTQLKLINGLRDALPAELLAGPDGRPTLPISRADVDELSRIDPFEAIRSADIMPLVEQTFTILDRKDYGGTLLHMLLHEIVANFDEGDPNHVALLRMACETERVLIEQGVIDSDFTVVVARRREAGAGGGISPSG
jgi:SAM-dependent methyltransferase